MQSGGVERRGSRLGNVRVRRGRRRSQTIDVRRLRIERPRRPGVLVLIAGFLALISAGTALLMLPIATEAGTSAGLWRALFTATSAVCVTGLVVVDTAGYWSPFGEAVILVLIQAGGLGFMLSSTLLLFLLRRRVSLAHRVMTGETSGHLGSDPVHVVVRRVIKLTLMFEAVGLVLLLGFFTLSEGWHPDELWHAVFTTVSAFNNAGFDIEGGGRSLLDWAGNPFVLLTIASLATFGALGYAIWSDVWTRRRWRTLSVNTKIALSTTAALTIGGAVVLLLREQLFSGALDEHGVAEAGVISLAESAYARTSGFTAVDLSLAGPETLLFIAGLMFIGGASGSTAGGIKLTTFSVLGYAILASLRGDEHVTAFGRELPWRQINRALAVALLSVAFVFAMTFALAQTTDAEFIYVLFEVVSAFATCGLSAGITGSLNEAGQVILIITMFVGRVGPLTVALALAERFGRRERVRYAEADINIG